MVCRFSFSVTQILALKLLSEALRMNLLSHLSVRTKYLISAVFAFVSIFAVASLFFLFSKADYEDIDSYNEVLVLHSTFSDFNAIVAQLPNIADNDFKFYKYGENKLVQDLQHLEDSIASDITTISKHPIILKNNLLFRVNGIYSKFDKYGLQVYHIIELLKQRGNVNSGLVRENISNSKELYKFGQKLAGNKKTAADFTRYLHYQKLYYVSNNKDYRDELSWYLNNIAYSTTQSGQNELKNVLSADEQKSLDALVENSIESLTKLIHLEEELSPSQKSGAWQTVRTLNKEIKTEFNALVTDYDQIVARKQKFRNNILYGVFILFLILNAIVSFFLYTELTVLFKQIFHFFEGIENVNTLPSTYQLNNVESKQFYNKSKLIINDRKNNFESLENIIHRKPVVETNHSAKSFGQDIMKRLQNYLIEIIDESEKRKEEETINAWQIKGQTEVESIFRRHDVQISDLSQQLVKTLVDYLEVNQGALFLFDEDENALKLFAAYSLGKFKAISETFELGDGLIGSCALERKAIYVTEIPENYFSIHSGLGEAKPKCIYLMPLSVDNRLYGVLELASFELFKPHELNLLEMLAINIGSGFARIKTSYESEILAKKTRKRSEEMAKREEELNLLLIQKESEEKALHDQIKSLQEQLVTIEQRMSRSKSNEELMHMEVLKYQELLRQMKSKEEETSSQDEQGE